MASNRQDAPGNMPKTELVMSEDPPEIRPMTSTTTAEPGPTKLNPSSLAYGQVIKKWEDQDLDELWIYLPLLIPDNPRFNAPTTFVINVKPGGISDVITLLPGHNYLSKSDSKLLEEHFAKPSVKKSYGNSIYHCKRRSLAEGESYENNFWDYLDPQKPQIISAIISTLRQPDEVAAALKMPRIEGTIIKEQLLQRQREIEQEFNTTISMQEEYLKLVSQTNEAQKAMRDASKMIFEGAA